MRKPMALWIVSAFLMLFAPNALGATSGVDCTREGADDPLLRSVSEMELAIINNPHVWELAEIGDELVQAFINGDKEAYSSALATGNLDEAAEALGLTEPQLADFERRLESARSSLMAELPGLAESMPRRSLTDDPSILAQQMQSLITNDDRLSSFSFLEILEEKKRRLGSLPNIQVNPFDGALNFLVPPPDFGPGPDPDPCVNPPCDPGQPPEGPPGEEEEIPPDVDPNADCAYVPYTASLAACTLTGVAGYVPCAIIAMCTWCDGGWIHTTCTP